MGTLNRNREVVPIASRLDKPSQAHLFTSYDAPDASSSRSADEIEIPLPTGPCAVWLSDSTVIGCEVDAAEWPDWTDDVRFGAGFGARRGGAR